MRSTPPRETARDRQGFVLVCVLWILAILTVMTLGFGRRAYLDARAASLTLDQAQARHMARGAVRRGVAEVQMRMLLRDRIRLPVESGGTEGGRLRLRIYGSTDLRDDFDGLFDGDYAEERCGVRVEDELGRFNINTVPEEILENLEDLEFGVASAILERREQNKEEGESPQPITVLEELLLFEDIKPEDWTGDGKRAGLRDLFTVFGEDEARVNVNTAPREVLMLLPDIEEDIVDAILAYRAGPDGALFTEDDQEFDDIGEISGRIDADPAALAPIAAYCMTQSEFFRITGFATRRQGRIRAQCMAVCSITDQATEILLWKEEVGGP